MKGFSLKPADLRRLAEQGRITLTDATEGKHAQARGRIDQLPKYYPYDSKTEQVFAKVGRIVLQGHIGKKFPILVYKPISFILPGETYRIDWLAIAEDGETWFLETKGSGKFHNYRDARSKLRAAAVLNPYWRFAELRWPQKQELQWTIRYVKGVEADDNG
jgi:hypothetical protein